MANSSPQKRQVHTRNGRRVRCNGLTWKHLCVDKKTVPYKRKYQRQSVPVEKTDQTNFNQMPIVSSDMIETSLESSSITRKKASQKRKTVGDMNNEEHIVPKRKPYGRRRKGRDKEMHFHSNRTKREFYSMSNPFTFVSMFLFCLGSTKSLTLSIEPTSSNTSVISLDFFVSIFIFFLFS
jgi:hypothetical protein